MREFNIGDKVVVNVDAKYPDWVNRHKNNGEIMTIAEIHDDECLCDTNYGRIWFRTGWLSRYIWDPSLKTTNIEQTLDMLI